jgi:hypothetical protein
LTRLAGGPINVERSRVPVLEEKSMQRAVALFVVGLAMAGRIAAAQGSCEGNYKSEGSFFKGKTYSTFADFAGVPVDVAVARLAQQAPSRQMEVLSVDAEHGVVRTRNQAPNQGPYPIDFTVEPIANGSRVKMVITLGPGGFALPGIRQGMCGVIALAASDPPGGLAPLQPAEAPDSAPAAAAAAPAAAAPAADDAAGSAAAEPPPYVPPQTARAASRAAAPRAADPQEPPLTNAEIVKLSQAGLGGEIIIAKIKEAAAESLDVSTDALIALRKRGVSRPVIAAMLERVSARAKP